MTVLEFRLEKSVVVLQFIALLLVLGPVVVLGILVAHDDLVVAPSGVAGAVLLVVVVVVAARGSLRSRVVVESDRIRVIGTLGTRTISCDRCAGVVGPPASPMLMWTDDEGRLRTTRLHMLAYTGSMAWLVRDGVRRRERFVGLVNEWASAAPAQA